MEVHAHSKPAPASHKKWRHYFWEFVMLFLAVTLGFLAENQREHYVERHRIKEYSRSLVSDLERDTTMINLVSFRISRNIRFTDSLRAYVRTRPFDQLRNIDLYVLSSIDRYPPYSWSRATLDQIKYSGSMRYIRNQEIINVISAYDALAHHMDEDQQNDDDLANTASDSRCTIINMDYPTDLMMGLRNNIDSVRGTEFLKNLLLRDSTKLITNNITCLQEYLNKKINIQKHLLIRTREELPRLKAQAATLISLLREEYHLK